MPAQVPTPSPPPRRASALSLAGHHFGQDSGGWITEARRGSRGWALLGVLSCGLEPCPELTARPAATAGEACFRLYSRFPLGKAATNSQGPILPADRPGSWRAAAQPTESLPWNQPPGSIFHLGPSSPPVPSRPRHAHTANQHGANNLPPTLQPRYLLSPPSLR